MFTDFANFKFWFIEWGNKGMVKTKIELCKFETKCAPLPTHVVLFDINYLSLIRSWSVGGGGVVGCLGYSNCEALTLHPISSR